MQTFLHVWYLAQFLLEREMFQTEVAEKIKTRFVFNNFFSENRAVYEIFFFLSFISNQKALHNGFL